MIQNNTKKKEAVKHTEDWNNYFEREIWKSSQYLPCQYESRERVCSTRRSGRGRSLQETFLKTESSSESFLRLRLERSG